MATKISELPVFEQKEYQLAETMLQSSWMNFFMLTGILITLLKGFNLVSTTLFMCMLFIFWIVIYIMAIIDVAELKRLYLKKE